MAACLHSSPSLMLSFIVVLFIFHVDPASSCGCSTHIEISHRAQDSFQAFHSKTNYEKLLLKHQDAMEAGSPYPDAYYDSLCFGGKYYNISEDTHWTPFLNATVNYIRKHYPQPWDEATEKLIVFFLGLVSHQIADINWHGLGIKQGFLDAMAAVNFHGVFGNAHSAGDVGGDIVGLYEFSYSYMPYIEEWYVPVDDLHNIYIELYGAELMPKNVIQLCTMELFAERLGEKLAIDKLYPDYAGKSPYLVDQLTDYFLGGLDDMAVWTQNLWQDTILMLEKGIEMCTLDRNPLFIQCKGQNQSFVQKSHTKPERNGFYQKRRFTNVQKEDIVVKKSLRGVTLHPSPRLKEALYLKEKKKMTSSMNKRKQQQHETSSSQKAPSGVYIVNNTYAKLGWSIVTGDLDRDGNEDAVIGAPGFRVGTSPQTGAVFVVFGTNEGLPLSVSNLEEGADVVFHGVKYANGRFGSSLAIVDINKDGWLDIAVGAPSTGTSLLTYAGSVEVLYGVGQRSFVHNMTVTCQNDSKTYVKLDWNMSLVKKDGGRAHYCNLGRLLTTGDINGDGFLDLLIASHFSGAKGDQRGQVTALVADKKYTGYVSELTVSQLYWTVFGSQNYSWFGYSVETVNNLFKKGDGMVFVSEPAWRKCAFLNCSFSDKDTQSVGQLNVFAVSKGQPLKLIARKRGVVDLQSYGSSIAVGKPYPGGSPVLAVGASGQDVDGSIADIPITFSQTGVVFLYNLSNPDHPPVAIFKGDRRYSRFGSQIKFFDINQDGYDDLILGAPHRTEDITEEIHAGEQGAVYIYYGGASFPKGDDALSQCPDFSVVKPCPNDMASVRFTFGEDRAYLGAQIAVVKSQKKVDLLVTALHSSRGGPLSGAVAVYSFPLN